MEKYIINTLFISVLGVGTRWKTTVFIPSAHDARWGERSAIVEWEGCMCVSLCLLSILTRFIISTGISVKIFNLGEGNGSLF